MKLIIQIPAFNEEATIATVIRAIPRHLPGIDCVEVLVIDDGSLDRTVEMAREAGADTVLSLNHNRGLAFAFQAGMDAGLRLGADIIVNTDADNQYPGEQITLLLKPILDRQADIVIGDRQVDRVQHFSLQKRLLERMGSWIVRAASGTNVPDAPSGFRAYSREAALRLFVTSDFSYTLDNLIQAGKRGLKVSHVPIRTNPTRPSKLHHGSWHFVKRQAATIVRAYATYEPLKTFFYLSLPFLTVSALFFIRLLVIYISDGLALTGHVQSLLVAIMLAIVGFLVLMFGLLADRIGDSRRLSEEILYRLRQAEAARREAPDAIDRARRDSAQTDDAATHDPIDPTAR
jgi:glycosyltransferase involved in cell wall biosynthesis